LFAIRELIFLLSMITTSGNSSAFKLRRYNLQLNSCNGHREVM